MCIVLGSEIASSLFEAVEPIGKIRVYGQRLPWSVEKGAPLFGESDDTSALFRLTF
jgi:hypothetical protein